MKSHLNGSLVWTVVLGLFVLMMVVVARGFQDSLQFTPYLAGFGTLAMILVLLAGNYYPEILRWTETTLQDLWGGGDTGDTTGGEGTVAEQEPPWPAVLRSMSYAVGFLVAVFLFGFALVPPLFVTLYLVVEAGVRFRWAMLAAVIVCALLIFGMVMLQVEVWAGIIPEIVEGYLGGSIIPPV
jgi:hypothetical protein